MHNGHKVALNSKNVGNELNEAASAKTIKDATSEEVAAAAKKVNEALDAKETEKASPPKKAEPVIRENIKSHEITGFDQPAVIVNNFQLSVAPHYVRLVGVEMSPTDAQHVRSVMAMDYPTLASLYGLLGNFLSSPMFEKFANEAAANNQKASVG